MWKNECLAYSMLNPHHIELLSLIISHSLQAEFHMEFGIDTNWRMLNMNTHKKT
jgi:hypothetical protein